MSSGFGRADRSRSDEGERFRALYEQTNEDLLAFLLRRCSTAEDAADCLAETYRVAWEKRAGIPAGDETRPWLFGVARNMIQRSFTHQQRSASLRQELAVAAGTAYVTPSPPAGPIVDALADLSPVDREIITMLIWDGLAPREVATVLGLSSNVVRVRAHRAKARLRESLGDGASLAAQRKARTSHRS